jgi:hypothetical protein
MGRVNEFKVESSVDDSNRCADRDVGSLDLKDCLA